MSAGLVWGILLTALSLPAWGGQVIAWRAPAAAQRLGLMEAQDSVEPAFWADVRGEAAWDSLTLWTMPVAGGLLVAGSPGWTYFGLVGAACTSTSPAGGSSRGSRCGVAGCGLGPRTG